MSADDKRPDAEMRGAIDALADRVDTLAAMVRETAGGLAASRGEVASLDRRVQDKIGEDTESAAAALESVRGELEALRSFVTEAPGRSGAVAAASSDPLRETITTLTERVETLGDIVRTTAGRLVAEQGRISVLTEALEKGDERTEAKLAAMERGLQAVSEQAARAAKPPPRRPEDSALEQRVDQKVGVLTERVEFLSSTVKTTAGGLASKDGEIARLERRGEETIAQTNEALRSVRNDTERVIVQTDEALRSMRDELQVLQARLAVDPTLKDRVDGLVDAVQTLGDRVGTLSGIVGETAGRATGRESEIAALDDRLGNVGARIEDVAHELRREIEALAATPTGGASSVADTAAIEAQVQAFGQQLLKLEVVVADASGAAEQVGQDLRVEIAALAEAVAKEHVDLVQATREWEARRAALEERMDELTVYATSTAERGAEEMGRALHTLAERLEALERDRLEVTSDATYAESAWAQERIALEERLDAIAASITVERSQSPEVEQMIAELAGRLARMEDERESVADLAALADTWTSELAALEARVGESLSTLEERAGSDASGVDAPFEAGLSESVDELTDRIAQIERDRDAVREELARTAASWATERASLQVHVAELAALATSTAERGAEEMGRALHTLAERLEALERDRLEVTSDATYAESAWAQERIALEERLDAIAASITVERPQAPEVAQLVDELAGRLARVEGERETVADLAALAETWAAELAALEARVDEGLSTLEEQAVADVRGDTGAGLDEALSESLDELTHRIDQIERDRDAVRDELTRTAASWAIERASLQERVAELAARIVTGPMPAVSDGQGEPFAQSPQEIDRLRIGVEGLRMRLAYHEKTVNDLAGSRGVVQRLDELSARLDQLAAVVASGTGQGAGAVSRVQVAPPETAGLLSRLEEAERMRSQNREKMLEQMEKIASRMDWRLQRLEAAGVGADAEDS